MDRFSKISMSGWTGIAVALDGQEYVIEHEESGRAADDEQPEAVADEGVSGEETLYEGRHHKSHRKHLDIQHLMAAKVLKNLTKVNTWFLYRLVFILIVHNVI